MTVVCIQNISVEKYLTKYKQYDILSTVSPDSVLNKDSMSSNSSLNRYWFLSDNGEEMILPSIYFITLEEFRNRQIDKLI